METCITCGRAFEPLALDVETFGECEGCWSRLPYRETCEEEYDDISQYLPPGSPVCVGCD